MIDLVKQFLLELLVERKLLESVKLALDVLRRDWLERQKIVWQLLEGTIVGHHLHVVAKHHLIELSLLLNVSFSRHLAYTSGLKVELVCEAGVQLAAVDVLVHLFL